MRSARLVLLGAFVVAGSAWPAAADAARSAPSHVRSTGTACWARFDVHGAEAGSDTVDCADGDPDCDTDGAADGVCTFAVRVCLDQAHVPGCVPRRIRTVTVKPPRARPPALPADAAVCGRTSRVRVRLRRAATKVRASRLRLRMVARAAGTRRTARDVLTLRCRPAGTCDQSCPANGAGPSSLDLTLASAGSDLDVGWTGAMHDWTLPDGARLTACLAGCDAATHPVCEARPAARSCSGRPAVVGPPVPLLAGRVPACVVTRVADADAAGTVDLGTGAIDLPLHLMSTAFLTDAARICPRCRTGTCDGGPNAGSACTVDGVATVADAVGGDTTFEVSRDCPPDDAMPLASVDLTVPLTTGTSTLVPLPGGTPAIPCARQPDEPAGPPALPDSCASGTCSATCAGPACANPDGRDPVTGDRVCIDRRGGIAQRCCSTRPRCCSTSTATPCFPTDADSGGSLQRTGKPAAGAVSGAGAVLAATFCLPATGVPAVDGFAGLPGPAALLVPVTETWR